MKFKKIMAGGLSAMMVFGSAGMTGMVFANDSAPTTPGTSVEQNLEEGYVFALVNIPYQQFYAQEGDASVDAVASATKTKPRTGSLAGGSYHKDNTGDDISGVVYPVKIKKDQLVALGGTEIKDDSSVSITVTNRGKESTTEYKGKEALFEAPDYSYYILNETPAYYKVATVSGKSVSFGKVQGEVKTVEGVEVSQLAVNGNHTDFEFVLNNTEGITQGSTNVSGVVLTTDDGKEYGLRHVVNIWRQTELGWNKDSKYDIDGKTITNIRYYTNESIIDYPVNIQVPTFVDTASGSAVNAKTVKVTGLPADIQNAKVSLLVKAGRTFTTVAENLALENGKVSLAEGLTEGTVYTVKVTSDNYGVKNFTFTYQEITSEDVEKLTEELAAANEAKAKAEANLQELQKKYATPGKASKVKVTAKKGSATISFKKAKNANQYQILRSTKKSSGYTTVKTVKSTKSTISYKNTKLKKGKTYYYKVRALNVSGNLTVTGGTTSAVKVKAK